MKSTTYRCPKCGVDVILPRVPVRHNGVLTCENRHWFFYKSPGTKVKRFRTFQAMRQWAGVNADRYHLNQVFIANTYALEYRQK